jgi:hypothetical protein
VNPGGIRISREKGLHRRVVPREPQGHREGASQARGSLPERSRTRAGECPRPSVGLVGGPGDLRPDGSCPDKSTHPPPRLAPRSALSRTALSRSACVNYQAVGCI